MKENKPLVCVIANELLTRESLTNLLRSAGLRVQAFASAQEFLAGRPQKSPSCLVLDVQLPGISGLGAVEFLTKPFRDEDLLNAIEQAIRRGHQIEQPIAAWVPGRSS
jgi:FixJ family two-component response regulator